jgi:putative Holliday junction resolvase
MPLYLALDPGNSRVGVALSDPTGTLASPLTVLKRKPHQAFLNSLKNLIQIYNPEALVIGLPLNDDGSLGKAAQKSLSLASELKKWLGIRVETIDESYSTLSAQEILEANQTDRANQAEKIDQIAAALILQKYLDLVPKK